MLAFFLKFSEDKKLVEMLKHEKVSPEKLAV